MGAIVAIEDVNIWFKHVHEPRLRHRLEALNENEAIYLETNGVVGRWRRLAKGRNPYLTPAIKPDGSMKAVWNEWFRTRKGEKIEIREVALADDFLAAGSALFSEWNSPEDEEAYHDL